ncbi:unnamed protein product [Coffea canephora]|uniref:Uncharacterized protein n=1 Tax=Coffea canephora TaxID=49390 RepID=A0A068V644_COFCA|nr:unnamed protein product [Coffea canephora]
MSSYVTKILYYQVYICIRRIPFEKKKSYPDAALASVLRVLNRIHSTFFDTENCSSLLDRDVRKVLKTVRK